MWENKNSGMLKGKRGYTTKMLYLDHLELGQFAVLIRDKRFKNLLISKVPQCLLGMILYHFICKSHICQEDSEKA